ERKYIGDGCSDACFMANFNSF
ncbi:unnamed protein product, partial [Adineta steineri]